VLGASFPLNSRQRAIGTENATPQTPTTRRRRRKGVGFGKEVSPVTDYGVWGSVMRSPSGVREEPWRKTSFCAF